ncbi:MAG TPA: PDZ domain-containing protein, partial [Aggregatilineales bacterium]|nr:PDZ domain-containing protein [Aggregatilineales bacterium]
TNGLLVVGVLQGGPADQAGIRLGDLFVVIEGQQLSTVSQAEALIQAHKPGDVVAVKAKRGDQTLDFSIRVAQRPVNIVGTPINVLTPGAETPSAGAPATAAPTAQSEGGDIPNGPRVKLGVTYEVVTPALVSEKNLSVDHGALVTTVTPGSPADVAGIKVGDVISEVDGDKVDAKRTLAIRMIPYIEGDTVVLTVVRGKQTLSISVTLVTRGSA